MCATSVSSLAFREQPFPMVLPLLFILGTAGPPDVLLRVSASALCSSRARCGSVLTRLCRGSSSAAVLMCKLLMLAALSQSCLCCLQLKLHCLLDPYLGLQPSFLESYRFIRALPVQQ